MKKLAIPVAAGLMALGMAAGFTSTVSAKTFVYCSEGSPEGFNPALYTSGTTFDASSRQVFNKLVEFKLGTTEVEPSLAESYSVSDDGLEYTFKLRKGVKFHDTKYFSPSRDFNADDVMFSFMRQWKEDHPYNKISGGDYRYWGYMSMTDLLKSIEKIDDYTVKFTLNQPEAPFIANMAMDFASIHSAEYADQMMAAGSPEKVDLEPIGTGPFKYQVYQKDAVIRYQAHDDYFNGRAKIDTLVFSITQDNSVAFQKLKAGECHMMPYPNPADLAAMEEDPDIKLKSQEGLNVGYLAFNTEKDPFGDKRVRQALNMAVNKQAIMDVVFQGAGRVAKNPIPPTMWSYNDSIQDYEYNPDKAKALLAEAGVSGLKTDIWAMPVQRPYNPNARRMAELIQADWAKIGVEAEIVSMEWGEYLTRTKEGAHQTMLLGWTGDNGDPDNFMYVLLGCDAAKTGGNRARWCNQEFEQLLRDAKQTTDTAVRTANYEKAQTIFKEEAPWITIAHSVVYKPMRKEVEGFVVDPLGGHVFYPVDLAE